ncbi:MAG: DegT/DnrJ/EryC1/StrS family aminotransferase [Treponema sp.]|jgi:dTDP-4-amino-4,6-dideoxygalactose transaminase|nr:DegT/DnrJ/EryC1/StrS family aminotransferase [Treponema sp.]
MQIEIYSPTIRRKEMDAVLTAMVEDKIGPGEQTKYLVQTAREKIKFDYCLALRSPAYALYLSLKALGLTSGDGVIVSALSPLYYAWVIQDLGLKPIFCDVLPFSTSIGRTTIEKAVSKNGGINIKCVVLHHTLGYLSDSSVLAESGFQVIDDQSQSYGTGSGEEDGCVSAEFGVFTILGLEERDMLTSGGGALLYSANRRDSTALRNLGDLPPEYGLPGMNAALAMVQFREAAKNLEKRREIARLYTNSALKTRHKLFVHKAGSSDSHVEYNNYAFPLILETGVKDVKAYARRKDIAVESAFEKTLMGSGIVPPEECPEAYSLSLRTVLFPIYPRLSMSDAGKVAKLILTLP